MSERYEFWIPALTTMKLLKGRPRGTGKIVHVAWLGGHCADPYRMGKERRHRWQEWREHVRQRAMLYLPRTPPRASRGWRVSTMACLAGKVHPDAENIHKAIVDCLVARRSKGSTGTGFFGEDKDLAGRFEAVSHEDDAQGVTVTVELVEWRGLTPTAR